MTVSPVSDLPQEILARLSAAASRLLQAGRSDPTEATSTTRLHCLLAVDHLVTAGATPQHLPPAREPGPAAADLEPLIRAALLDLATLPRDVFARTDVLQAAIAAQEALDWLDRP